MVAAGRPQAEQGGGGEVGAGRLASDEERQAGKLRIVEQGVGHGLAVVEAGRVRVLGGQSIGDRDDEGTGLAGDAFELSVLVGRVPQDEATTMGVQVDGPRLVGAHHPAADPVERAVDGEPVAGHRLVGHPVRRAEGPCLQRSGVVERDRLGVGAGLGPNPGGEVDDREREHGPDATPVRVDPGLRSPVGRRARSTRGRHGP